MTFMGYTVYILYSNSGDKYYIGSTNNFQRRLQEHNGPNAKFTKKYQPWVTVYTETFKTRAEAVNVERYLKSLKNKERLHQYIAGWRSKYFSSSPK